MHTVYYIRSDPLQTSFLTVNRSSLVTAVSQYIHQIGKRITSMKSRVLPVKTHQRSSPSVPTWPTGPLVLRVQLQHLQPGDEYGQYGPRGNSVQWLSENPSTKQIQTLHVATRRHRDQTLHFFQSSRWYADQCFSTQIYPLLTR